MGQAIRMITYDRAANEQNAITALEVSHDSCCRLHFVASVSHRPPNSLLTLHTPDC